MCIFARAFGLGVKPVKDISVSEFAEMYIYNPSNTADAGKFTLDRAPYQKAIFDTLTPGNDITDVALIAGAQLGKTFAGQIWQAYIMTIDPQNFISYQPTISLSESYVSLKIDPFIECNPIIKSLFKKRDDSTKSRKKYKGCTAEYKGANSATSFRMISAPYIDADEIDSYEHDIDGEGSPLDLIENRTATFGKRRKIFWKSTPTIKDSSAIEKKFLQGNQNYYHVPCPYCNCKQVLKFDNLKCIREKGGNNDDDVAIESSIYYECEICKAHITEDKKTWMLLGGEWIAENPNAPKNIVSFQISSLYSPLGWLSWKQILDKFFQAVNDPFALKAFKNTYLGETYYEKSEQPSHYKLKARAEKYNCYEVNEKAVTLFAGCDTQDDRLCVSVIAFGESMEAWTVAYEEIPGSPADNQTWANLETVLRRPYKHKSGVELFIKAAAVDSGGHFTNNVYDFCRRNQDLCYAIKGASHDISVYIKESDKLDIDPRTGKRFPNPLSLYLINTMLIKKYIYIALNNMLVNDKLDGEKVIHFSHELQQNFYEMLTSERLIKKIINGRLKEEFVKPKKNTRNEVLDCFVYAYAMAFMHQIHNLYGSQYLKVWELNINKKIQRKENEDKKIEQVKRPAKKKSFVNKTGFAIRR